MGIIDTVMTTALAISLDNDIVFGLTFAGSKDRLEMGQKMSRLQARGCPLTVS